MNHYDDAVARGACPDCTDDRKAVWHHHVPCPFSDASPGSSVVGDRGALSSEVA